MPWSGEAADGPDMPYLLAYSLGDAEGGPEATAAAVERLLADNGLPVGGELVDGTAQAQPAVQPARRGRPGRPHHAGLNAQCPPPPEWLAAVGERGYAYLVFTTRAWPEADARQARRRRRRWPRSRAPKRP